MNKINAGSKAGWNNFNIYRIPIYEKWKNKTISIIPAPFISASSILSFSVNIDFEFVRKKISQ